MTTFTSSLPDDVLNQLGKMANKLAIPKNKIIEKALRIYLDQLNRAEYVKSYKQAADDLNIIELAEEGMADYLNQLENHEL
ncbi:MAG: CopG family transcriptional regulator [Mariniphaga sp.]|nr:CopG family transcriptional regulator [Mariniphaga sp.]